MQVAHHSTAARRLAFTLLFPALVLGSQALARTETIELANGDLYEGEVVDDLRTGQGIYVWADGHRYEGQFEANRMHGQGVYFWPDGRTYTGSFVTDRREGRGVLRWPNGDVYEGEFRDNKMHGTGRFVWANQDAYVGDDSAGFEAKTSSTRAGDSG